MAKIDRQKYASMYGPTVGDKQGEKEPKRATRTKFGAKNM